MAFLLDLQNTDNYADSDPGPESIHFSTVSPSFCVSGWSVVAC